MLKGKAMVSFEQTVEMPFEGGILRLYPEEDLLTMFSDNRFDWPQLANINCETELNGNVESPLKLMGALQNGKYKKQQLEFNSSLALAEKFIYERDSVRVTLEQAGFLKVKVENNKFQLAEFKRVQGEADIDIGGQRPLLLGGRLDGKYEDGKIDFDGSIPLRESFQYSRDQVKVTLKAGERLEVTVEKSEFQSVEFEGVQGEADIDVPETNGLKLGGAIDGKYENGLIDFDGSLSLRESFDYSKGPVGFHIPSDCSGSQQNMTVKTDDNELSKLDFSNNCAQVLLDFSSGSLELDGAVVDGNYKGGFFAVKASLNVEETFEFEYEGKQLVIEPGPAFLFLTEQSNPRVVLKTANGTSVVLPIPEAPPIICMDDSDCGCNGELVPCSTFNIETDCTGQYGCQWDTLDPTAPYCGPTDAGVFTECSEISFDQCNSRDNCYTMSCVEGVCQQPLK